MRSFLLSIFPLVFTTLALFASAEATGQRPTDYDYFVKAITPAFQRTVSRSVDSLKVNETRRTVAEQKLKTLLKPHRFYLVNLENLNDEILATQLNGEQLALATATLAWLQLADERVTEWGRVAKVGRNLTAKSFVRSLYERHKNAWTSNKTNTEWATTLIDREVIRYALLFQRRKDNFSSLEARKSIPAKLSSSNVKYGNPIPARDAEVFSWKLKTKLSNPTATEGITTAGTIPPEDILCSYPQNGQFSFHPREYRDHSGYLLLSRSHYELREIAEVGHLWMKWKNIKGEIVYSDVTVTTAGLLQYGLPVTFLRKNGVYKLSMVRIDPLVFDKEVAFFAKKPVADLVSNNVYLSERKPKERPEHIFFQAYFRTSTYASFLTKTMYTARLETSDDPNVFTLKVPEAYGREDLEGINGVPALAPLRPAASVSSESEVGSLFGRDAQLYLNHPNSEYLAYLKENKDNINVDSLVAIEFLPFGERARKYSRLRYAGLNGKRRNAFTRSVEIPALQKISFVADYGDIPARITEAEFQDKIPVKSGSGMLTFRYVFHEKANDSIAKLTEQFAKRKPEYISLLKQLNELSPQVATGTDFSALLDKISPGVVRKLSGYVAPGLSPEQTFSIGTGYSLPGRTITSSSHQIKVLE